jgi:pimeloyl-ACP methyl ester carboxylesterase
MKSIDTNGNFAKVNGLNIYYEVYGKGMPLLLLPGAVSGINTAFGALIPLLAKQRQVIALEFQGYGHTADIPERPLSYEQFADDVIAFLNFMNIKQTDIFGYSTGAGVALVVTMRKPALVNKLILASGTYKSSGRHPQFNELAKLLNVETMKGTPYESEYLSTAPRPEDWPKHLAKALTFNQEIQDWPEEDIQKIKVPALIIAGDADIVQPEHAVSLYKLLGGGGIGELSMPMSQLAILPGTMHTALTTKTDLLMAMIPDFLEDN